MTPIFRRFGIITHTSDTIKEHVVKIRHESEVTLNLAHIVRVTHDDNGDTWIACADGSLWLSSIDYNHLVDALDGELRYR